MKRLLIFIYGVSCYAVFVATLAYLAGFIGNVFVPKSIDSAPVAPLAPSLVIDLSLLGLFALQHSGMARPAFKRGVVRFLPASAERSTYVLLSSACLALLMWQWAPLGGVIWDLSAHGAAILLTALYVTSWALLLYATFLIDHYELFGLRQVLCALKALPRPAPVFRTPALYRFVRHPTRIAWLGAVWLTPTMTMTHFVFAVAASLYILVGIRFEERDLLTVHPEYAQYKQKVPALMPSWRRRLDSSAGIRVDWRRFPSRAAPAPSSKNGRST